MCEALLANRLETRLIDTLSHLLCTFRKHNFLKNSKTANKLGVSIVRPRVHGHYWFSFPPAAAGAAGGRATPLGMFPEK